MHPINFTMNTDMLTFMFQESRTISNALRAGFMGHESSRTSMGIIIPTKITMMYVGGFMTTDGAPTC